jgi:hypothetical protein
MPSENLIPAILAVLPAAPPSIPWFGEEVARNTARRLVVYHRRSGGQSQFSSLLQLKAPGGRFGLSSARH